MKYVEKGEYPNSRRHFGVLRCNHCDNAPCVKICPTKALFVRDNGIVDLDGEKCIGCSSCMQACPYDAIYINPSRGVAEKCHYCAHRVERGLEPACVIVCPVQAIVPGDLDHPESEISKLVATIPTQTRKPEQGTRPKVFYLGADNGAISPGLGHADIPASYLWAEGPAEILQQLTDPSRLPETREVYNVAHERRWGWHISAYLWTKSIAAGTAMVAAAIELLARAEKQFSGTGIDLVTHQAPLISIVFLMITAGLLVLDLKQPQRFWRLLFAPNWTSWLVWGGYIIMAFGAATGLWWLMPDAPSPLLAVSALLGIATAGYSAFLFGQAEGRDFWQSPLLLPHLLAQAIVAGAAFLMAWGQAIGADLPDGVRWLLAAGLGAHFLMVCGEVMTSHTNQDAARAARHVTRERRGIFWWAVIGLGVALPMLAVLLVGAPAYGVAGVAALAGVLAYEHLWVQAGQAAELS